MRHEGLTFNYDAEATILAHRIVKFGSADTKVTVATDGTDPLIGVTTFIDSDAGEPCDVVHGGSFDVIYGGTVARGDFLTAGADGKAVTAGAGDHIVGQALRSGEADDLGAMLITQQPPAGAA